MGADHSGEWQAIKALLTANTYFEAARDVGRRRCFGDFVFESASDLPKGQTRPEK